MEDSKLVSMLMQNDIEKAKEHIQNNVIYDDELDFTLYLASGRGFFDIVKELSRKVDKENCYILKKAISYAKDNHKFDIMEYLIELHEQIEPKKAKDLSFYLIKNTIIYNDDIRGFNILLPRIDPKMEDSECLYLAAKYNYPEIVEILFELSNWKVVKLDLEEHLDIKSNFDNRRLSLFLNLCNAKKTKQSLEDEIKIKMDKKICKNKIM